MNAEMEDASGTSSTSASFLFSSDGTGLVAGAAMEFEDFATATFLRRKYVN